MKDFIIKYKQLSLAAALAVLLLIALGVTSLVGFIRDFDKSEADKLKERADRYFITSDFRNAVNLYNMALEKDPAYEEIYIILHDYYLEIDERLEVLEILEQAVFNTDSAKLHAMYENADRPMIFPSDDTEDYFRRRDYIEKLTYNERGGWIANKVEPLEGELWRSDFDDLTDFRFLGFVDDLSFFKQFRNLEFLAVIADGETDLSALSELTNLRVISFIGSGESSKPVSLPSLSRLTQLEHLDFRSGVELADFEALKELPLSVSMSFFCNLTNNNTPYILKLAELQRSPSLYLYCDSSTEDLSFLRAFSEKEMLLYIFLTDTIPDLSSLYNFSGKLSISLTLDKDKDTDLSALSGLTSLRSLSVDNRRAQSSHIFDLSPLANLTNLESLSISRSHGGITDISPLANLKKLERLSLTYIESHDLSPLAGLTALTTLSIYGRYDENALPYDLSPLSELTKLTYLFIGGGFYGRPYDLSPLSNLTKLEFLYLPPQVDDISALANLTSLMYLRLDGATNITSLSALENLTSLRILSLERCSGITDITPLAGLVDLESLHMAGTGVTDISALAGMSEDLDLRIDFLKISDISPIQHIIDKGGAYNPNIYIQVN